MRNGLYGVASQVAFSAANFAIAFAALHLLTIEEISSIAYIQTTLLFLTTLVNSLVCVPFSLSVRDEKSKSRKTKESAIFYIQSLFVSGCVSIFMIILNLIFTNLYLIDSIFVFVYCLIFQFRSSQRNILISKRESKKSLFLEIAGSAPLILSFFALYVFSGSVDLSFFVIILAITSVLPIFIGQFLEGATDFRPRRSALKLLLLNFKRIGFQSLLGTLPSEIVVNAHIYVLTIVQQPALLASVYSTSILFRHVTIIYAGLRSVLLPEIVKRMRSGMGSTRAYVFWMSSILFIAPIINMSLFMLLPAAIITLVLGENAGNHEMSWLVVWGVIYSLVGLRVPYFCYQQAVKQFSLMTRAVFLSSLISIALYAIYIFRPSATALMWAMIAPQFVYSTGLGMLTFLSPIANKKAML